MLRRWQLTQIARVLDSGGVIAYPTESVFGLGCHPDSPAAIQAILDIKKRPIEKGLIILVSDISQALPYIRPLSPQALKQVTSPQSRATSWLMPALDTTSVFLRGQFSTLAVRITQHPVARQICNFTGHALVSTSCNPGGKPETRNVTRVRNSMHDKLDWIVPGTCGGQNPSRLIDLTSRRVLRD